jgi:hypothetical protein
MKKFRTVASGSMRLLRAAFNTPPKSLVDPIFGDDVVIARAVYEEKHQDPQFSGLLDEDGRPMFKFYDRKPGIGFHCADLADYDPDQYYYGVHPSFGPVTISRLQSQEEDDDADGEDD